MVSTLEVATTQIAATVVAATVVATAVIVTAVIATAVIATAVIVPRVIGRPTVSRLLACLALTEAEVAHGAEKLLGNHATDEACCQTGEDRAAHAAHARSPAYAAEEALHRPRLTHLGPCRQPRQALRVFTPPS